MVLDSERGSFGETRPPLSVLSPPPDGRRAKGIARLRYHLRRHGRKLWWLHSLYALGLGTTVVLFAQRGFAHARWLAVSLGLAWLLVVAFFRLFGSGARQTNVDAAPPKARLGFYAMTYALKNLYQGMLFFLLPFYWRSTTFGAPNAWFIFLLGVCAIVSTLDIVFDRYLMRFRSLASIFHGITLFGCINLIIPALLPNTRSLVSLLTATAITVVGFWTLHVPPSALRQRLHVAFLATSVFSAVSLIYFARVAIPPVPLHVAHAGVGPALLDDGRLAMEVKMLHSSIISQLLAVTDVVNPGGRGDRLLHVWRRDGLEIRRSTDEIARVPGPHGTVRIQSSLAGHDLPRPLAGRWTVDVETEDGQLVGRTSFTVVD